MDVVHKKMIRTLLKQPQRLSNAQEKSDLKTRSIAEVLRSKGKITPLPALIASHFISNAIFLKMGKNTEKSITTLQQLLLDPGLKNSILILMMTTSAFMILILIMNLKTT